MAYEDDDDDLSRNLLSAGGSPISSYGYDPLSFGHPAAAPEGSAGGLGESVSTTAGPTLQHAGFGGLGPSLGTQVASTAPVRINPPPTLTVPQPEKHALSPLVTDEGAHPPGQPSGLTPNINSLLGGPFNPPFAATPGEAMGQGNVGPVPAGSVGVMGGGAWKMPDLPPEAWGVLTKIASGEATSYNQRYAGTGNKAAFFNDYRDHPRIKERSPDGPSDAAGMFQFLSSTWDTEARKLGLKDFSPPNQVRAAWDLATTVYNKDGRDLLADAKAGKVDWSRLASTWTSLKRGGGMRAEVPPASDKVTSGAGTAGGTSGAGMDQFNQMNEHYRKLMQWAMLRSALSQVQVPFQHYDPWAVHRFAVGGGY